MVSLPPSVTPDADCIGAPGDELCPHGGRATPRGGPVRGSCAGPGRRGARIGAEAAGQRTASPPAGRTRSATGSNACVWPFRGPRKGQRHALGPLVAQLLPSPGSERFFCRRMHVIRPSPRCFCRRMHVIDMRTHLWASCRPDVAPRLPSSLSRLLIDRHTGRRRDTHTHGSTPGPAAHNLAAPSPPATSSANVHHASEGEGSSGPGRP
jgi:hypothetical protein